MPRTIELSHRTVIFTVLFLGLVWFLVQVAPIIVGLFIAILLMAALNPSVEKLVHARVPRPLAILIVYLLLITIVVLGLVWIIPPFVDQTTKLVNRLPFLVEQLGGWLESLGLAGVDESLLESQISQIGTIPINLVRFTISLFSNVIAVFSVLIITFYLLVERRNLDRYLVVLFGNGGEKKAKLFVDRLEARLGGWVRGELILMFIIGLLTYIGLRLLGIPFALPLAIIAGFLEIVPNIGPVISAIPAVIVALTLSPVMALATAALYFLVQQLENSIVVPKVMQKATGVNPLVTILSLAIGFHLAGPLGAILAVPVVIVIHVLATEFIFPRALG
ncbi:MAG: AI-2E family transporter [Candidatus Blackburnbacteria bacterium]|nr:AI-2E family transporter [Candidatus Blackburnbacteria bacterium]